MIEVDSSDAPTVMPPALAPGRRVFGRFVLDAEVGRGGMGVVWRARDERLAEWVALKFIAAHLRGDPAGLAELRAETKRTRVLTHPNIVRVHDLCEDAGLTALAMEFIDGRTLTAIRLDPRRSRPVLECAEIARWLPQLCAALDYAHREAGVAHRDLKPGNVMLTAGGQVKVTDFGVARSLADTQMKLTAWSGPGTLAYMSPQQQMGEPPSPADDLYGLGALLYELLSGKPPFYTGNIAAQVQGRRPDSVAGRRRALGFAEGGEAVPERWERALAACLAKDPARRPESGAELLARLGDEAKGRSLRGKGGPGWRVAVLAGGAALVAVAGAMIKGRVIAEPGLPADGQRVARVPSIDSAATAARTAPEPDGAPFMLTRSLMRWQGDQLGLVRSEVSAGGGIAAWEALKPWADVVGPEVVERLGLGALEMGWVRHEGVGSPDNSAHFIVRRPGGPGMKAVVATAAGGALELSYASEGEGRVVATSWEKTVGSEGWDEGRVAQEGGGTGADELSGAVLGETRLDMGGGPIPDWRVTEEGAVVRREGRWTVGGEGGRWAARHGFAGNMRFVAFVVRGNLADNVGGMAHTLRCLRKDGRAVSLALERPEGAEPRLRAVAGRREAPEVVRALPGGFGEFTLDVVMRDRRVRVRLLSAASGLEIWSEVLVLEDLSFDELVAFEWEVSSAGGKEVWLEQLMVRME